jgi:hypothetical protein
MTKMKKSEKKTILHKTLHSNPKIRNLIELKRRDELMCIGSASTSLYTRIILERVIKRQQQNVATRYFY